MPNKANLSEDQLVECLNVRKLLAHHKETYGMTQHTLGKLIGRNSRTVSAIVNGRIPVTTHIAKKIAKVFEVPLSEILPWAADLESNNAHSEFIEDLNELSHENRAVVLRMIRKLLESQEDF